MNQKPILVLDFDGVLHSYDSKWTTPSEIPDPPVAGSLEFVQSALEHFTVAVFSSRSSDSGGRNAMIGWLARHGFPTDLMLFPIHKPPAFLTIDDRAITFTGVFPNPQELLKFNPWNKKKPSIYYNNTDKGIWPEFINE